QEAESTIQKDLPNFYVSKLIGQNIDIFHKNPDRQKAMLSDMKQTFATTIKVGGRLFDLIAEPVFSDKGERLGTSVEWKDAEQRLQIAEYAALADAISRS